MKCKHRKTRRYIQGWGFLMLSPFQDRDRDRDRDREIERENERVSESKSVVNVVEMQ